jgi:hypothetical protein
MTSISCGAVGASTGTSVIAMSSPAIRALTMSARSSAIAPSV